MSDPERSELRAARELAMLVGYLAEELAAFRRRALTAETRLKELEQSGAVGAEDRALHENANELRRENASLKERLDAATARTQQMLDRVHFLRQQAQAGER